MSMTPYARRRRDRTRRKRKAWLAVEAFLAAHKPCPSSAEFFAEYERPFREAVVRRAALYEPAWGQVLRLAAEAMSDAGTYS